jgi:hypothetical protein
MALWLWVLVIRSNKSIGKQFPRQYHKEKASTLKKRKLIFPHVQYKEIQKGAVAKSYMTNGLLIYDYSKYLCVSSYIRKSFLIYDFATTPVWISLYSIRGKFYFLVSQRKVFKFQKRYFNMVLLLFKYSPSLLNAVEKEYWSNSISWVFCDLKTYNIQKKFAMISFKSHAKHDEFWEG